MEREELEGIEVEVGLAENQSEIMLRVGNSVAFLNIEQALDVAEKLAEIAGYIEGLESGEPVDPMIHQAPERLQ